MNDAIKGAGQDKLMAPNPDDNAQANGNIGHLACGCPSVREDGKDAIWPVQNDFMTMNGKRIGIQIVQCTTCLKNVGIGAIEIAQPLIQAPGPTRLPPTG